MLTSSPGDARAPEVAGHLPFEAIALLFQGGGALGSYQGGVYQRWPRPAFIPTGWPAFRSGRSIRFDRRKPAGAPRRQAA